MTSPWGDAGLQSLPQFLIGPHFRILNTDFTQNLVLRYYRRGAGPEMKRPRRVAQF